MQLIIQKEKYCGGGETSEGVWFHSDLNTFSPLNAACKWFSTKGPLQTSMRATEFK